jgi:hypothetical protein
MNQDAEELSVAMSEREEQRLKALRWRRRSWLLNHLLIYFAVMVVIVPINALSAPEDPWFLIPLIAWGAPLAVHTAWVMELFGKPKLPPDDG